MIAHECNVARATRFASVLVTFKVCTSLVFHDNDLKTNKTNTVLNCVITNILRYVSEFQWAEFNLAGSLTISLIWILINCFERAFLVALINFPKIAKWIYPQGKATFIIYHFLTRWVTSLEEFAQLKIVQANRKTCRASSCHSKKLNELYLPHQCILLNMNTAHKKIHSHFWQPWTNQIRWLHGKNQSELGNPSSARNRWRVKGLPRKPIIITTIGWMKTNLYSQLRTL